MLSRIEPAKRPIDIAELATPLRYDIAIRRQFFRLLKENETLYRSNQRAFAELAKETEYFGWFKHIWWGKVLSEVDCHIRDG